MQVALFDLDGTLSDTTHRYLLAPTVDASSSWSVYAKACGNDTPIWDVVAILRIMFATHEVHIISGRDGSALEETKAWLSKHNIPYDRLTLRPADNEDSNADIKVTYVHKLREEGLDPVILFDDWRPTCDAVRELNVAVLQVGNMNRLEPDGSDLL